MFTKKIFSFFVITMFAFIYSASEIKAQDKRLKVSATITVQNIAVDATMDAVDTGIQVRQGDIIKVTAEGEFKLFPADKNWTYEGDTTKPAPDRAHLHSQMPSVMH